MTASAYTKTGKKHDKNQDSFYIKYENEQGLFIVADGMGGHAAGDTASKTAIEVICDNLEKYNEKSITESLKKANTAVLEKAKSNTELEGMGTTVVICCITGDKIIAAHIGDSRMYVIEEGKPVFITRDHSYVQQLVERGEISESEAKEHPMKNIITNALGVQEDLYIETDKLKSKNGRVVICSDGVSNILADSEIAKTAAENEPQTAARLLCENAQAAGGTDDLTAIVIDLRGEK